MNILIVEDELLAAERLQELITKNNPEAIIVEQFDSVADTVQFFRSRKAVDLLMLDIQLADGKSFEIFDQVHIDVPVIFTTAYDHFALHAFKYYSIDYLLKPVQPEDLTNAISKFKRLVTPRILQSAELSAIKEFIDKAGKQYKERFIIKTGNKLQFKQETEVAFFFADGKNVYLVTKQDNRKYLIDHTLEELERTLNPILFFRISRKHIIRIDSIMEVRGLISGKLDLKLNQPCDHELSVSRDRVSEFKTWLNR
jgi:DNA-binding LytR/AlgR family response regulator